jgi:hypothetical protein
MVAMVVSFDKREGKGGGRGAAGLKFNPQPPPSTMAEYTLELVHILQNPSAVILRNSRDKMR